jgi:hypothetical protein
MTASKSSASAELIIEVSEKSGFICHPLMLFIVTAIRDQHHFLASLGENLSTKTSGFWLICLILETFMS